MKRIILFSLVAIAMIVTSCRKDKFPGEFGVLKGKVVAANEVKEVKRALVFVEVDHDIYYAYTDANGDFTLNAPEGKHILNIQTGGGSKFRSTFEVTIKGGEETVLAQRLPLNQNARLAYVSGSYDAIEDVVTGLGYTVDQLTFADLANYNTLAQYNGIFLNCGGNVTMDSLNSANLANYVANGGSLYASDWSVSYYLGNYTGGTCPAVRPFGFISDATMCTERSGASGMITGAQIMSPDIQAILNKTSMDIEYDLGGWERIITVDQSFWEVMVRNSSNQEPLLVRSKQFTNSNSGNGNVGVPNTGWVTICHIPPGNPNNPITITINANGWPAHQAHGCYLGACNGVSTSGTIYYTTFHNAHNHTVAPDVEAILEYIVFNL